MLVPELRGHPPSGGSCVTYGLLEAGDVAALLHEASRRGADTGRVGVDGASMGALVALRLAALHRGVTALWLQAPFADLAQTAARYLARSTGLSPALLSVPARAAVCLVGASLGVPPSAVDPIAAAREVSVPSFVVIGEEDVFVPAASAAEVAAALAGEASLWRVPRAGHAHHPDEPQVVARRAYVARWTEFFSRHLPPAERRGRA